MRIFIPLALVLAIFTSGCGNKEPSSASRQTHATSSQTTRLKPFELLIDWQAEPTYLGIYYAKTIGAFKDLGLDVKVIQSWGANEAARAISAGKYKIGTASGAATVIADSSGANLISTAVLYHRLPTAIFGLRETGIKVPKDLEGKTVGIYAGSITKNEFEAFAKLNDVNLHKVKVVSISGPDLPLILSRKVDAVLDYFELSPTQLALERPTFQMLLDEYGVKGYGLNVITSKANYEKDPALIEGITKGILRGYQEGCAHQKAATAAFLKEFPRKDPKFVHISWGKVCKFVAGDYGGQTVRGWQNTIDLYKKLGLLNGPVTPQDIIPPGKAK